ncbi:MAG: beta strand repeat-containing protein [Acidobacteriota bacterium]
MNNPRKHSTGANVLRLLVTALIVLAFFGRAAAQTPGGTVISNQASASYSDGTNTYETVSNTVTVTVSNVSGITITPDAGSNPTVVAGQTGVLYDFTVSNTGNFTDQVRFLASGASVRVVGPGAITRAVIDDDNNGFDAGDADIFTNGADVLSANIAQSGSIRVLVEVSVNAGATAGQTVQVLLGDASTGGPSFDNQAANSSANEVRTVSATSVNGLREGRGDISVTVANDALLQLTLTAPSGPVAVGSDITYGWQVCNNGARDASGVTLNASTQVYIIAPVPARTVLTSGQTFPAGTLYTTSALTTAPLSATWSSSAPVPLSNTTRLAFPVGATLAAGGACSASINMIVTINTGIDASVPIDEIGDAFGRNTVSATITDQSGDATPNNGDGNANFNEGYVAGAGHGVIQQTTLTQIGSVLIGPSGAAGAVGPNDNNDDYTNKSVNTGIAGIAPGGATTAQGQLVYVNTVQNTGNSADTFTIDAPTVPAGFTVEVSTDGGTNYTTVSGGGSVSLAVAFGASANIHVRITEPAGNTVLTGFDTVLRATSTVTPAASNRTIDRLYTGFVRLVKSYTVSNSTGVGGATDAVPGAVITYNITYENISTSNGDASCVKLTAQNVVITEDGLAAPNNWGTFTTHTGTPSDTGSGVVVIVNATTYTDTVASLGPGVSAVFSFQRSIN